MFNVILLFRFKNKLRYFEAGTSEQLASSCKGLHNDIELIVSDIFIWTILLSMEFNRQLNKRERSIFLVSPHF